MRKETKGLIALATMTAAGATAHLAYDKAADSTLDRLFTSDHFIDVSSNGDESCVVTCKGLDNVKLKGHLLLNDSSKFIILVHDYDDDYRSMSRYADEFSSMGYSILLLEQRGVGEYDGAFRTCGIREQFDILCWIAYLDDRFAHPDITLVGDGLGALSCLLTLKSRVDANLKTVIAINSPLGISDYLAENSDLKGSKLLLKIALRRRVIKELEYDLKDGDVKDLTMSKKVSVCFTAGEGHKDDAKALFGRYDGVRKYYPLKEGCVSALEDRSFFKNITLYLKDYFD